MSEKITDLERNTRLAQAEHTLWALGVSGLSATIPPQLAMDIAALIKEHRQLRIQILKMSVDKQLEKKWEHQQPELDPSKDLDTQLNNLLSPSPRKPS